MKVQGIFSVVIFTLFMSMSLVYGQNDKACFTEFGARVEVGKYHQDVVTCKRYSCDPIKGLMIEQCQHMGPTIIVVESSHEIPELEHDIETVYPNCCPTAQSIRKNRKTSGIDATMALPIRPPRS